MFCWGNNYRCCDPTDPAFPAPALGTENRAGHLGDLGNFYYNSGLFSTPAGGSVYFCDSNVYGCANICFGGGGTGPVPCDQTRNDEPHPLRPNPGAACVPEPDSRGRLYCANDLEMKHTIDDPNGWGGFVCPPPADGSGWVGPPSGLPYGDPYDISVRVEHIGDYFAPVPTGTPIPTGEPIPTPTGVPVYACYYTYKRVIEDIEFNPQIDHTALDLPIAGVASRGCRGQAPAPGCYSDTQAGNALMTNYTSWYHQGVVDAQEPTLPNVPTGGGCQKIGVNSAAWFAQPSGFYDRALSYNLGWTLEIARANEAAATVDGLNQALSRGLTPIIRIGTTNDSGGFDTNPQTYINFLSEVASQVSAPFYALAGPNEPSSEHWLGCSDEEYDCIGQTVTTYMNAIISAKQAGQIPGNVLLLSPAFNITSHTFQPIVDSMKSYDARFSELDAIAGNAYNIDGLTITGWLTEREVFGKFLGQSIVLTEIGAYEGGLIGLGAEIQAIKNDPRIIGALLFNAFGTNDEFAQFEISPGDFPLVIGPGCAGTATVVTDWITLMGPIRKLIPKYILDVHKNALLDRVLAGQSYNQIIAYARDDQVISRLEAIGGYDQAIRIKDMDEHRTPDPSDEFWYLIWSRYMPFTSNVDLPGRLFATYSAREPTEYKEPKLVIEKPNYDIYFPHQQELEGASQLLQSIFKPEELPSTTGFEEPNQPDYGILQREVTYQRAPGRSWAGEVTGFDTPRPPYDTDYCSLIGRSNIGDRLHDEGQPGNNTITGWLFVTKPVEFKGTIYSDGRPSEPPRGGTGGAVSVYIQNPLETDNVWDRLLHGPTAVFRALFPNIEREELDLPAKSSQFTSGGGLTYYCGPDCGVHPGGNPPTTFGREGPVPAIAYFPHWGTMLDDFHYLLQNMLSPLGQAMVSPPGSGLGLPPSPGSCTELDYVIDYRNTSIMSRPLNELLDIYWSLFPGNQLETYYDTIIEECREAGYNPAFCLTIWLEESGASDYSQYPGVADFGCISLDRANFRVQFDCFLGLFGDYTGYLGHSPSFEEWMLIFSEGFAWMDESSPYYYKFCSNSQFPGRVQNFYRQVTGG